MSDWVFFRRVLVVLATVTVAYLVWKSAALFFLFFAAVLIAVLLAGFVGLVAKLTSISRGWALAASSVTVAAVVVAILSLFGTQLAGQISDVFARLPDVIEAGGEQLGIHNANRSSRRSRRKAAASCCRLLLRASHWKCGARAKRRCCGSVPFGHLSLAEPSAMPSHDCDAHLQALAIAFDDHAEVGHCCIQ